MPKQKKSLLVSSLIVGVPILAFLAVNTLLVYRSDREVAARLEAIRAAGDAVTVADFPAESDLAPDEDARAILEGVQQLCEEIRQFAADRQAELESQAGRPLYRGYGPYGQIPPYLLPTWPPKSTDPPRVFDDPMPAIRKAAAAKGWRFNPVRLRSGPAVSEEYLEAEYYVNGWQALTSTLGVLSMHADYCMAKAQWSDAVDDAVAALRLTDLYANRSVHESRELSIYRQEAYRRLGRLLQRKKVEPELIDRIEQGLPRTPLDETLQASLKRIRASLITHYRQDFTLGRVWLVRAFSNRMLLSELDDAEALLADPASIRNHPGPVYSNAWSIRGSFRQHWDEIAAQRTLLRSLSVLIALKRLENPDSLVASDDTLDPGRLSLAAEITTDPYTEKPLIIRKKDDGWLIYGLGPDESDDFGAIHADEYGYGNEDVGIGPDPKPGAP